MSLQQLYFLGQRGVGAHEILDFSHRVQNGGVVAAADLKRLIDKTQFAISTEETRYYLNGIYLHTAGAGKAQTLRDRKSTRLNSSH